MKNKTRLYFSIVAIIFICFLSSQTAKAQYVMSSIPFTPDSFSGGMRVDTIDDVWSDTISLPFSFCFFGQQYDKLWIGTNGVITFNYPGSPNVGGTCLWALTPGTPFPNSGPWATNCIMGAYTDINPQVSSGQMGSTNWKITGTAPYRKMVISYDEIPFFQCTSILVKSQIILYETTNIIDINIADKGMCSTWNMGYAVEGIENNGGTAGYIVPGRNNGNLWSAHNDGQRFTPTSGPCAIFGAGPDMTTCLHTSVQLTGGLIGTWSSLSSNPSPTTIAFPNHSATIVSGFDSIGVYTFIYSDSTRSDTMTVTIVPIPNGGPDIIVCPYASQASMAAVTPGGAWSTWNWNPTNALIDSPASPISTVSHLGTAGVYHFLWSVNGCADTVYVIVENAGSDQYTCLNSSATLWATGSGSWSQLTGQPAMVNIADSSQAHTQVTGFSQSGVYGFAWTGLCVDTTYIIVYPPMNAGPDRVACLNGGVQMAATGQGYWYALPSNSGSSTIANVSDSNAYISNFGFTGIYNFVWDYGGCSDTANVVVIQANAGYPQTICQYSQATMTATGLGSWTADSSNPAPTTIANPTSAVSTISGFTLPGTYSFIWNENGCTDQVQITVNPKPGAGPDISICQNTSLTMNAAGSGMWYAAASNPSVVNVVSPTAYNSLVNGFTAMGIYYLYWSNSFCQDTVAINVINCSDSVWPGDADANHLVDNSDLLPIGLAYTATGPVRPVTGMVWQADYAADWGTIFVSGADYKHADCNGDGTIDYSDTLAIIQNFGLTHSKNRGSRPWRSSNPALVAKASMDTIFNNTMLTITFYLGDNALSLQNFYGLAFIYNFDPLVVDSAFTDIDFGNSWLGTNASKMSIRKIFHNTGEIKAAVSGFDHNNRTGYGPIGTATFKISTAYLHSIGSTHYVNLGYISDIKAVDNLGHDIQLNEGADTTVITTIPEGISEFSNENIYLQPNPANGKIWLTAENAIQDLTVYDVTGKQVWNRSPKGVRSMDIDVSGLAGGLYLVHVATEHGTSIVKLTVLR